MRMRALRPSPSYQILRRSRKRRASTRTTGSTRESKEAGRSYASTATTYSFTRSDSPRRACSTEKRRKRQSRSERQKRSLAKIRPSSSRINSSRCGSIHIWRASRAPRDCLIVTDRSSTSPGETGMGHCPEQKKIVGPDFRLARLESGRGRNSEKAAQTCLKRETALVGRHFDEGTDQISRAVEFDIH